MPLMIGHWSKIFRYGFKMESEDNLRGFSKLPLTH